MTRSDRALETLPGLPPGVVPFVAFPSLYYVGNGGDLHEVGTAGVVFGAAFLVWSLLVLAATNPGRRTSRFFVKDSFFLGVYLLQADVVSPLQIGPIAKGNELAVSGEPWIETMMQLAIAIVVTLVGVFTTWSRGLEMFGTVVVLTLLLVNSFSVLGLFQAAGYRVSDYQSLKRGYGNADYAVRPRIWRSTVPPEGIELAIFSENGKRRAHPELQGPPHA